MTGSSRLATPAEIRGVIVAREKLLIHFNGPTSRHPVGYPNDLRDALGSPSWRMCYSTIGRDDLPWTEAPTPGEASALGMVGLIADIEPRTQVVRVCSSDAGSDGRAHGLALGQAPTVEACEQSIDQAVGRHNEWLVTDVKFVGVFAWPSPIVHAGGQQRQLSLNNVVADFPNERVFTAKDGSIREFDRLTGEWVPRDYADVMKR